MVLVAGLVLLGSVVGPPPKVEVERFLNDLREMSALSPDGNASRAPNYPLPEGEIQWRQTPRGRWLATLSKGFLVEWGTEPDQPKRFTFRHLDGDAAGRLEDLTLERLDRIALRVVTAMTPPDRSIKIRGEWAGNTRRYWASPQYLGISSGELVELELHPPSGLVLGLNVEIDPDQKFSERGRTAKLITRGEAMGIGLDGYLRSDPLPTAVYVGLGLSWSQPREPKLGRADFGQAERDLQRRDETGPYYSLSVGLSNSDLGSPVYYVTIDAIDGRVVCVEVENPGRHDAVRTPSNGWGTLTLNARNIPVRVTKSESESNEHPPVEALLTDFRGKLWPIGRRGEFWVGTGFRLKIEADSPLPEPKRLTPFYSLGHQL